MITPNQISDAFQSSLGRAPTPYETKTYSTASPQTIAGLKNSYTSLKPNQSIVDYMKYTGQDPATTGTLASKYGISNIGTAEGNMALLSALKSGKQPVVQGELAKAPSGSYASVSGGGTIDQPAVNPLVAGKVQGDPFLNTPGTTTPIEGTVPTPASTPTIPGSVSAAATSGTNITDQSNPLSDPNISSQKDAYVTAQRNVETVSKQIADLTNTINSALYEKKRQVASSGGIVNEAQLTSEVYTENQPLLQQIAALRAERAQAVSEQSIAGQAYQSSLGSFYKSASLQQAQQKIEQGQQKIDVQQQQFGEKMTQTGYKEQKVNVYDEYGNITGQKVVWTQNPGSKTGFASDGSQVNITHTSSGASVQGDTQGNVTHTSTSIPSIAPVATGSNVDVSTPGYTTAMTTFQGKHTQLTQAYIDQIAVAAIMNGGSIPSGSVRGGSKGLPIVQQNAIKARIGQLDPGGNLAANKASAKAWGDALTVQIKYTTNLQGALQSADNMMKNVVDTYKNSGINTNIPIANSIANASAYNLGSADVAAFRTAIKEVQNAYQQVFSRSGQVSDAVRTASTEAINDTMSLDQLTTISKQLQAMGKADLQGRTANIADIQSSLTGIVPGAAKTGAHTPDVSSPDWLSTYNYDSDIAAAKEAIAQGAPQDQVLAKLKQKYKDVSL